MTLKVAKWERAGIHYENVNIQQVADAEKIMLCHDEIK